jgi:hypothetical protein
MDWGRRMTLQEGTKITKGDLSVGRTGTKQKAAFYGGALTRRRYRGTPALTGDPYFYLVELASESELDGCRLPFLHFTGLARRSRLPVRASSRQYHSYGSEKNQSPVTR